MNNTVNINTELNKEILMPLRMFVSGLASGANFTIDEIEDLKVSFNEVLLLLLNYGYKKLDLNINSDNGIKIEVKASEHLNSNHEISEFSIAIIKELVDKFEYNDKDFSNIVIEKRKVSLWI